LKEGGRKKNFKTEKMGRKTGKNRGEKEKQQQTKRKKEKEIIELA